MALSAALRRRTSAGGRAGRRTRPNLRADLSGVRCARSRSARSRDRSVPLASRAAVASSANALAFDPETRAGVRSAACPPGRAATSMLTIDRFPLAGVCTATGGSFVRQSNGADCLASAGLRSRTVTRRYIPPRKAGTNVAWAPEKSLLRRECPGFEDMSQTGGGPAAEFRFDPRSLAAELLAGGQRSVRYHASLELRGNRRQNQGPDKLLTMSDQRSLPYAASAWRGGQPALGVV
jgi:hypothetical protein